MCEGDQRQLLHRGSRVSDVSPHTHIQDTTHLTRLACLTNSETMQYEIDRDSSILEQILPDSEERMDLVDGIPKTDDEK